METNYPSFSNGDLMNDIEKHLRCDCENVGKDSYHNGVETVWVIDVNDDSYVYYSEQDRDSDYGKLNKFLTINH